MPTTNLPMTEGPFGVVPSLPPSIPVTAEIQQAMALLLGYFQGQQVPIQASPVGALRTDSPPLKDVYHLTAAGANQNNQGSDIKASEVLCMAHPDNVGRVWVRTMAAATTANGFPLAAGEGIAFSLDNLNQLHSLIVTAADKLIVAYAV